MIHEPRSPEFYSRSSEISFTVSVTLAICIFVAAVAILALRSGWNV